MEIRKKQKTLPKYRFRILSTQYEFEGTAYTMCYIRELFYNRLDRNGVAACYVAKRISKTEYSELKLIWFKLS